MKKILFILLFVTSLFSSDSLFREYKAGEDISKYFNESYLNNSLVDCSKFDISFSEISKCYFIRDDIKIGEEDFLNLVLVTINNKISSVLLFQIESNQHLGESFFTELMTEKVKIYSINSYGEEIKEVGSLVGGDLRILFVKDGYNTLKKDNESFNIEFIFVESDFDDYEFISLFELIKTEPNKINKIFRIIDGYNIDTDKWVFKLEIYDVLNQINLVKSVNNFTKKEDVSKQ